MGLPPSSLGREAGPALYSLPLAPLPALAPYCEAKVKVSASMSGRQLTFGDQRPWGEWVEVGGQGNTMSEHNAGQ